MVELVDLLMSMRETRDDMPKQKNKVCEDEAKKEEEKEEAAKRLLAAANSRKRTGSNTIYLGDDSDVNSTSSGSAKESAV